MIRVKYASSKNVHTYHARCTKNASKILNSIIHQHKIAHLVTYLGNFHQVAHKFSMQQIKKQFKYWSTDGAVLDKFAISKRNYICFLSAKQNYSKICVFFDPDLYVTLNILAGRGSMHLLPKFSISFKVILNKIYELPYKNATHFILVCITVDELLTFKVRVRILGHHCMKTILNTLLKTIRKKVFIQSTCFPLT